MSAHIEEGFCAALIRHLNTLTAVSGRIFAGELSNAAPIPSLVINTVSDQTHRTSSGVSDEADIFLEFEAIASLKAETLVVKKAVADAIDARRVVLPMPLGATDGYTLTSCTISGTGSTFNSQTKMWTTSFTAEISFFHQT